MTYLKVVVKAGARREKVEEMKNGSLRLSVKEPAEANQANRRVRTIVAERLGVPVARVRIHTGHKTGSKMLYIS